MRNVFIGAVVLSFVAITQAGLIQEVAVHVNVEQTSGATAQYTHGNGQLDWSGGNLAYISTDAGFYVFDNASVNASLGLYSDDSSGGTAKARFNLLSDWTVSLFSTDYGDNPVMTITGNMYSGSPFNGKYWESETGYERLDGKAWVTVTGIWADETWLDDNFGGSLVWGGSDNVAGLDSDVTLNAGTGHLGDYQHDYTSTNGLTLTLFSDQNQVVPEPATMVLLGLGAVLLRKKSR